ncbi:entericidin A/B family lipoprotein [bacterium]|nr:entericidin A/B family lipoprotein [bacterium]
MKPMIAVLIAAAFVLAGCNTMQGLGQDIEKLGDKIQKKAE